MNEIIEHPEHYTHGKYECIDVMIDNFGSEKVKDFCLCNAYKYLWRHMKKMGLKISKKAEWYLRKLIELEDDVNEVRNG